MASIESWQSRAQRAQQAVLDSIPSQWKLSAEAKSRQDALAVIYDCELLSEHQLRITELNACELLERLETRRLSCVEVTEAFLTRTAIAHQMVNCLVEFCPDEARARARELDDVLCDTMQPVGPLHGLPMTVKDILDVQGKVTTFATIAWLDNSPAETDASLVKVMRDAGAVIIGRTTMPQTGMALETVSNAWGRTLNAFNPDFGSGGSSGGEAVLTALRGVPASPLSTDIGGSIRAPAAFNGLYAIRPSSERTPKTGARSAAPGNVSIKVSTGPACHSLADLKLLTKQILTHPTLPHEPSCMLPYWHEPNPCPRKLKIGVLSTDGVVDPHPPIQRAMRETCAKLLEAGHFVSAFQPPIDLWKAAQTTWALYFQTGAKELVALLRQTGEPPIRQFQHNFDAFGIKELTVPELFQRNVEQARFKAAFQQAWDAAELDCIICPCAPGAGFPHDFPIWWYESVLTICAMLTQRHAGDTPPFGTSWIIHRLWFR
jgi:amidase